MENLLPKSKMDPVHMLQYAYDEETRSFKMIMTNLEIAVELRADDGDSVLVRKELNELKVTSGDIIDTSKVSKICMVGATTVDILAIMSDNTELPLTTLLSGKPQELCISKIKVMANCYIILQS